MYMKSYYTYLGQRLNFILMMWGRREQRVLNYEFGVVDSFPARGSVSCRVKCVQETNAERRT